MKRIRWSIPRRRRQSNGEDSIRAGATARLHQTLPKLERGGQDRRLFRFQNRRVDSGDRRQSNFNRYSGRHFLFGRRYRPIFFMTMFQDGALWVSLRKNGEFIIFFHSVQKDFPHIFCGTTLAFRKLQTPRARRGGKSPAAGRMSSIKNTLQRENRKNTRRRQCP